MIKRIIRKFSINYYAPLRFLASPAIAGQVLREIKEVDLKETTKKIVIPGLVTPVKLRCVAIRSSALLLFSIFHFTFSNAQQRNAKVKCSLPKFS